MPEVEETPATEEKPAAETYEIPRTESIAEFITAVADGNRIQAPPLPLASQCKEMVRKLIEEASKPDWQTKFADIAALPNDDPLSRWRKHDMLTSKVCLAALKSYGFKHGVDAKRSIQHFGTTAEFEDDEDSKNELKGLLKDFETAIQMPEMLAKPNPKTGEAATKS